MQRVERRLDRLRRRRLSQRFKQRSEVAFGGGQFRRAAAGERQCEQRHAAVGVDLEQAPDEDRAAQGREPASREFEPDVTVGVGQVIRRDLARPVLDERHAQAREVELRDEARRDFPVGDDVDAGGSDELCIANRLEADVVRPVLRVARWAAPGDGDELGMELPRDGAGTGGKARLANAARHRRDVAGRTEGVEAGDQRFTAGLRVRDEDQPAHARRALHDVDRPGMQFLRDRLAIGVVDRHSQKLLERQRLAYARPGASCSSSQRLTSNISRLNIEAGAFPLRRRSTGIELRWGDNRLE